MEHNSGKIIAKNTVFLYFRMLLTMGVALYTSRIVLEVLGASDYGLYNVVGGVVTMLGFINSSMGAGTSRFITYELGRGNKKRLSEVFNVALVSHIIIALIIFILAETIGLWFVNTQMVFPGARTLAVNVVYQASVFTAMLQFTQIPYSADIIAHEQMAVYAYVSIFEVGLKLAAVLLLKYISTSDALITYAILLFVVQVVVILTYRVYCSRKYIESKWHFVKDTRTYREIFTFSGWDVIGGLCSVTQGQGMNIILNMFFGPIVNAARAISYQVQGAFQQFTDNFMTAVNPEIVKSYAREDYQPMVKLINASSLYSYYLLLLLVMPVMFKLKVLLDVWLKNVPNHTVDFTLIILGCMMIRAIARPVVMAVHATGDIKYLNLISGSIGLLPLPIAVVGLHLGANALFVFWILFVFSIIGNITEFLILKHNLPEFSIKKHLTFVYLRVFIITIITSSVVYLISLYFKNTFLSFCMYYPVSLILSGLIIFYLGLSKDLRTKIIRIVRNKLCKKLP